MYDTTQEIEVQESFDKDEVAEPMKIIFQPSKDEPKQYFETWEEADKVAEQYWIDNFDRLKKELELNFNMTSEAD